MSVVCHISIVQAEISVMDVQLPFYDGDEYECMQNSHDTPTHNSLYTMYDLDFGMPTGSLVVAAYDGIMHIGSDTGFGKYARVDHDNGYWSIYGHLSGYIAKDGDYVSAGQPIAYSGNTGNSTGAHLHFGVHSGDNIGISRSMNVYGFDQTANQSDFFTTSNEANTSEFKCRIMSTDGKTVVKLGHIYQANSIGKSFSNFSCKILADNAGVLCWENNPVDCIDGTNQIRYYKNNEGAFQTESGIGVWRWCDKDTGQTQNILTYLEGGYGVGGSGPGWPTETTDQTQINLPDFITTKVWLTTTSGIETYTYDASQEIKMTAQFANIGSETCSEKNDIIVHFYLSKGYKEDSHDQWIRVGTDEIQCENLKAGTTKSEPEIEGLKPWEHALSPGIYNIVACVDHPKDDHNDGGDFKEEHESNNCSMEAVFDIRSPTGTTENSDCSMSLTCSSDATAIIPIINDLLTDPELTVNIKGKGVVTSTPSGIKCPGVCTQDFNDQTVILTAKPKKGSVFVSWSDGCDPNKRKNVCKLDVTADKAITATFKKK